MSQKRTCKIEWLEQETDIRQSIFKTLPNPNLLQDPAYGKAIATHNHQTHHIAIIKIEGVRAGYVQILQSTALKNALHVIILDRGPLWFDGFGSIKDFTAFLTAFRAQYPKRWGRKIRIIPEMPPSAELDAIMAQHKFHKQKSTYQSLIIDLNQSEQNLRKKLKKNWRGTLKKAEKANLIVEWDNKGVHLHTFLKSYAIDKKTKGYDGPSVQLLQALANIYTPLGDMLIGRAMYKNEVLGAVLIFCHGQSATYQIGWTTQKGRNLGAHNMLLWDAIKNLKNRGHAAFDLGGVNETEAKNVKAFKDGTGGAPLMLAGLYT